MSQQTEHEKRISQEIEKMYSKEIPKEIMHKLDEIRIQTIDRESQRGIILVKLPEEIISIVHISYLKLINSLKSQYPDFFVFVIRNASNKSISRNKKEVHENWIKDICYPALVEMRKTDVFNGTDKVESAFVSTEVIYNENDFSAMEYAFKMLTGRMIYYNYIFY